MEGLRIEGVRTADNEANWKEGASNGGGWKRVKTKAVNSAQ